MQQDLLAPIHRRVGSAQVYQADCSVYFTTLDDLVRHLREAGARGDLSLGGDKELPRKPMTSRGW